MSASATYSVAAAGLPLGRRVPRGRLRWYLVQVPAGDVQAACARTLAIIDSDLLQDAFVPRVERWGKFGDTWTIRTIDLFPGYFVAVSSDAARLSRALVRLSFPVQLAGAVGSGYAPIAAEAQDFLAASMDASHVIRASEAELVGDQLRVYRGPLMGQERRVRKLNRHKRLASVSVGEQGESFSLLLPLGVPVRRGE